MKTRTVQNLIDERESVERIARELGIALPDVFLPDDDMDWDLVDDEDTGLEPWIDQDSDSDL